MSIRNEITKSVTISNGYTNVNRFTSNDNLDSNVLYKAQNVDLTRGIGLVVTAPGYTTGSNITTGTLYGAHCLTLSSGSTIPLAHIGTTMYRYVGGWSATALTSLAASKSEFCTYLDYAFVTDGTQVLSSTNGSAWGATKLTSAPTTGILDIEAYKLRLYLLTNKTLYWSSLPDNSLAITWNQTDWNVDINPYDGDVCVALGKLRARLLIFKKYSTWRFYQYGDTDVDIVPISEKVGVPNSRAYAIDPDGTIGYLFGTSVDGFKGIYATDGESMDIISRPIKDIIDGVSDSNLTNICASLVNNKVKFYLGDVTLKDGSTITKCEVQYSPVERVWQWRSLSHAPVIYLPIVVDTTRGSYFLDTSSNIYQDEVGSTFGGQPIHCEIETPWRRLSSIAEQILSRVITVSGQNLSKLQTRIKAIESEKWVDSSARVEESYVNQSMATTKGSRFKVNITWTQPVMTYDADRVTIEKLELGFKQGKEPIS